MIETVSVFRIDWSESERGWGQRPDGYSLHLTKEAALCHIDAHWAAQPPRINGMAPDIYDLPGEPFPFLVNYTIHDELLRTTWLRIY